MNSKPFLYLNDVFKRPFPLETDPVKRLLVASLFGIGVGTILVVFEPFGLHEVRSTWKTLILEVYGVITFVCMVLNFFVAEKIFPRLFDEEHWNVGKHILFTLWNILLIGVCNYLYSYIVFSFALDWEPLVYFVLWSFSIGLIPVIIWALILERRYWKQNVTGAAKMNLSLEEQRKEQVKQQAREQGKEQHRENITQTPQHHNSARAASKLVTLTGAGTKEHYELNPSSILCIQADDNYVTLFYEAANSVKKILFRATLKSLAEQLAEHDNFFRCHKSYIVNLVLIHKVSGNAQGYKLHLPLLDFVVPVSRSLQNEILEKVQHVEQV